MSYYVPGLPTIGNTNLPDASAIKLSAIKQAAIRANKESRSKTQKSINDTEKSIATLKTKLKVAEKGVSTKQAAIIAYKKAQTPKLAPEGPGTPTAAQTLHLNNLEQQKQEFKNEVSVINTKLAILNSSLKSLKTELKELGTTSQFSRSSQSLQINSTFDTGSPNNSGDADKLIYKYNLPMLKSAYFHPFGPQSKSVIDPKLISAPEFTNARASWNGVTPARGTLQMSKLYADNIPQGKKKKLPNGTRRNETPYGFRFLYNPTEVTMAWGIVDAFSPEYAQSGANGMSGVAIGLMKGTIAFTLLLNRIGDLNAVDKDGDYVGRFADIGSDNLNDPTSYLAGRYGIGSGLAVPSNYGVADNPWAVPGEPSIEERKTLWLRGTMYDIEYLFRAMGGYYADYESGLNGKTADRGWLQPIPMELTLGSGLRYLVRVSSLDLKHMMFNERMVPILTTVNVVCTRYYDSPDAFIDPTAYSPEKDPSKDK